MFKKLKDKLEEEFKQGPLKFSASVQQLAQVISPSPSLNSLSENAVSSVSFANDPSNVSTDFFSIGGDEENQDGNEKVALQQPLQTVDLRASSPPNLAQPRSRRSSLSSVTSEASSLFPIFENPSGQHFLQSDLESEMEDGMPSQIEKITKEQLYQSYRKIFNRYSKYKGRYVELVRHYKDLQHDNVKTKNVLQESQDKALRRIAELKEQCQLEQNAKAHLEESLRNDVEDRDHMITTLKTKISLLRTGAGGGNDSLLIDTNEEKEELAEMERLRLENDSLQKEINDLKKLKETACHLIHRCDTTIDEATEDDSNENLKKKMSELKSEIIKMKSENESLSHILSRNVITSDEDRKSQSPGTPQENHLLIDFSGSDPSQNDEKSKKIEKLNNLLLKCKEKISGLNTEIKSKNLVIEDKNKKIREITQELESCRGSLEELNAELKALKVREEENVLSVAENKMAIHRELETKEEQIRALTKELKTSENEFRKEKDEVMKKCEEKLKTVAEDFARKLKYKNEEIETLSGDSAEKLLQWEIQFKKLLETVTSENSCKSLLELKSAEIESATEKLEERILGFHEKLKDFLERKQWRNDSEIPMQDVRDLNPEIENLRNKIRLLESRLEESQIDQDKLNGEFTEKTKELNEKIAEMEREKEKMESEKEKLLEEVRTVQNRNSLLEKNNLDIKDAETKLKEYVEKYKNLEKENQLLEKDLVQKCDKLVKDLNDSRERTKNFESESKKKDEEIDKLRKELEKMVAGESSELSRLRNELELVQREKNGYNELAVSHNILNDKFENLSAELKSLTEVLTKTEEEKKAIELEKCKLIKELESANQTVRIESDAKMKLMCRISELEQENRALEAEQDRFKDLETERNCLVVDQLREKNNREVEVAKLISVTNSLKEELEALKARYEKEKQSLKEEGERRVKIVEEELVAAAAADRGAQLIVDQLKSSLTEERSEKEQLKQELVDREKKACELEEKVKKLSEDRDEKSGSFQMKCNELEALKATLNSTREELEEKVKALQDEKARLVSENENKLNVLKNEIKFINNKFEEDIRNMEENRTVEVNHLNSRLELAEKTSSELLKKLEGITAEKEDAEACLTERRGKVSEMEESLAALQLQLQQAMEESRSDDAKKNAGDVEALRTKLEEYEDIIQKLKISNERLKNSGGELTEDGPLPLDTVDLDGNTEKSLDGEVEEFILEKNTFSPLNVEKEVDLDAFESKESMRNQILQQTAEMKELKKQYKREVTELRKIISAKRRSRRNSSEHPDWGGTLDNDTEHEYLRNILYEYMMGKEQLVLAKVLSAIVKFDKQQTRNVLEKEQHRQTLFGQLGIL